MDSKEFRQRKFTLQGRMFYPELFEPKAKKTTGRPSQQGGPPPKLQYSLLLAWPIAGDAKQMATLKEIDAHLRAGIATFFPKIPRENLQLPLKKWGVYKKKNGENPQVFLQDCYWMNMAANVDFRPQVVDIHKQDVIDKQEVYSGRNVLVSFSFWEYSNQNYGISVNPRAVMLLDGGEKVVGGVDIGEAFDSFLEQNPTASSTQHADTESLV